MKNYLFSLLAMLMTFNTSAYALEKQTAFIRLVRRTTLSLSPKSLMATLQQMPSMLLSSTAAAW